MTTPPSDPYESPQPHHGDRPPTQPPRYGENPPQYPQQPPGQPPPGQPHGQPPPGQPYGQPPPGYPAAPYGQQGYPAAPYGQPPVKPEPPRSILNAVKLMYAGAVLSLIWTLLVLPQRDIFRDAFADQDLDMTASEIDSFANVVLGVMIILGLITIALWVWMAKANRDGKSWARVVATILGALAILGGLLGLLQVDIIGLVMNLVLVVLAVWILVLLYHRDSTEYYNVVSHQPRY